MGDFPSVRGQDQLRNRLVTADDPVVGAADWIDGVVEGPRDSPAPTPGFVRACSVDDRSGPIVGDDVRFPSRERRANRRTRLARRTTSVPIDNKPGGPP